MGKLLWKPSEERITRSNMYRFMTFVNERHLMAFLNLTKNIKTEIYYLLQSTNSSHEWTDVNALGTSIKISF